MIKNAISSETVKTTTRELYQSIVDAFSLDPVAVIALIKEGKNFPSTVRDGIFFECFESYILRLNEYDSGKKEFIENNLQKLAVSLAEASPNEVSGYVGDNNRLHEYSKRLIKLIDDCGTIQKAVYLANISRALANKEINRRLFFKLGQCIRMLTEEDIIFLRDNIKEGIINSDSDYIDDFRGLGLMYDTYGGYAYSKRAFLFLKYALDYEGIVYIPEKFPERNAWTTASDDDIDKIISNSFEIMDE